MSAVGALPVDTYPTLQRMVRCREHAAACRAAGLVGPSTEPRTWWGATNPWFRARRQDRRGPQGEYYDQLERKRKGHVRYHRAVPVALRREVMAAGVCVYCLGPAELVDHIVPVSRSGTRHRRNLAAACRPCNADKGDMLPSEWMANREARGHPLPVQMEDWALTLAGQILATE